MKKIKKVLSFLTAAAMLCGVAMPVEPIMQMGTMITAHATKILGTCGENLTWEYDTSTKVLTISGAGEMEDYDILNSHYAQWWQYGDDIERLDIADSVTHIGDGAFYKCTSLTSVTIPDNVRSIGNTAFAYCFSLSTVMIPDGVTSIGDSAFYGSSLTSVTIPVSVTSIENAAFYGCTSLTSVTIKNPDCVIYDAPGTICNDEHFNAVNGYHAYVFSGTIYGYDDSTAQAYAEKYGYAFDSLGNAFKLGDVNLDSNINAGDAAMTLSAAAAYGATGSYGNLTATQIAAADIDENGSVNASDAAYILQYAAIKGANGKEFDIQELVK